MPMAENRFPLLAQALLEGKRITSDKDSDDPSPRYRLNGDTLPPSSPLRQELEDSESVDDLVWERIRETSWHWWERLTGFVQQE